MHRFGIALSAAVVLSLFPFAPSAAALLPPLTAIANGAGGPLVDVGYRRHRGCCYNKRRHHKRGYSGLGFYWYGGHNFYPRKVYRHGYGYKKYGYGKRGYRGYVKVGDVRICF